MSCFGDPDWENTWSHAQPDGLKQDAHTLSEELTLGQSSAKWDAQRRPRADKEEEMQYFFCTDWI